MVGWHHRLNGHEFEQALGDNEGQGSLGRLQSLGSQRVRNHRANEEKICDKGSISSSWGECLTNGVLKKPGFWDFLVVQWLRFCILIQGVQVQSLIRKLRSHMPCY